MHRSGLSIIGSKKYDLDDKLLNLTFQYNDRTDSNIYSLGPVERATVMSLANYDDVSCDILGIFKTNAMNISPSEAALFPWVCRANHSCDPNCNYYHNADSGRQELYCTRVIRPGEEVTVSYLPDTVIGARDTRRRHLMESHRFLCECAVCSMTGAELEEEERLRDQCVMRIRELNKMAETLPLSIGDCPIKRKYKHGCLALLSQLEGMAVPLPTVYNVKVCMFSIYIMLGDSINGVIWAQELIRLNRGTWLAVAVFVISVIFF